MDPAPSKDPREKLLCPAVSPARSQAGCGTALGTSGRWRWIRLAPVTRGAGACSQPEPWQSLETLHFPTLTIIRAGTEVCADAALGGQRTAKDPVGDNPGCLHMPVPAAPYPGARAPRRHSEDVMGTHSGGLLPSVSYGAQVRKGPFLCAWGTLPQTFLGNSEGDPYSNRQNRVPHIGALWKE